MRNFSSGEAKAIAAVYLAVMGVMVKRRRAVLGSMMSGGIFRDGAVVSAVINAVGCGVGLAIGSHRHLDSVGALANLATVVTAVMNTRGAGGGAKGVSAAKAIAAVAAAWAMRLGTFLTYRAAHLGEDKRLAKMTAPTQTMFVWFLQFVWGYVTVLPALTAAAAVESAGEPAADATASAEASSAGTVFGALGLIIESVADQQKMAFKSLHPSKFMSTGLFAYSRHPNYLGEMMLWFGLALAALPLTLAHRTRSNILSALTLLSPAYVYAFIRYVSGVPMLQRAANKRYGKDPAYQAYKRQTGLLLPKFPGATAQEEQAGKKGAAAKL